jgi:hypothetical protein
VQESRVADEVNFDRSVGWNTWCGRRPPPSQLAVSGVDGSIASFGRWFDFARELDRDPDGTVFLTDCDGFDARVPHRPPAASVRWHFGFTYAHRDRVVALGGRGRGSGCPGDRRPRHVRVRGLQVPDADGYRIGAYFVPRA